MQHPPPEETLDRILLGRIDLWQAKRGYRTAIDSPLLAWFAAQHAPHARTAVDLGAGSGLVAITLARALPQLHVTLVERQPQLADRATRNLGRNGLADRAVVCVTDLLELPVLPPVDLVVCNPPYQPRTQGHAPQHPERQIAHQETTATLADFARCAAQALNDNGQSFWVFPHHGLPRLLAALRLAGLPDLAVLPVLHRPNDAAPTRVLVRARRGVAQDLTLPARAIHLQDQPDRVFQPDLHAFFERLGPPLAP